MAERLRLESSSGVSGEQQSVGSGPGRGTCVLELETFTINIVMSFRLPL